MSVRQTQFKIELLCDQPEWWNFNIYAMVVCYDAAGLVSGFNNFADKVREISGGENEQGPAVARERELIFLTDPCDYAEIYLYAVTNRLPHSVLIKDSPPFEIGMRISAEGRRLSQTVFMVDQLGGLTVAAHRIGFDDGETKVINSVQKER